MRRTILTAFWTLAWPVAAFLMIGLALMGDPMEGALETRRLFAVGALFGAVGIYAIGYWLILRKRVR